MFNWLTPLLDDPSPAYLEEVGRLRLVVRKLTIAQRQLLQRIAAAGPIGMVVPGTLGATARVLRDHGLVRYVDDSKPPRQVLTEAGKMAVEGI